MGVKYVEGYAVTTIERRKCHNLYKHQWVRRTFRKSECTVCGMIREKLSRTEVQYFTVEGFFAGHRAPECKPR